MRLNASIKTFFELMKPQVDYIIKYINEERKEKNLPILTKNDEQSIKLSATYKFIDSLSDRINENDIITSYDFKIGVDGRVIGTITIERDGINYPLQTISIYAGGYNIQKLHTRYIVHTNIPYFKGSIKEELKELKRLERYARTKETKEHRKLSSLRYDLKKENELINEFSNMTDEQYIEKNIICFSTDFDTALNNTFNGSIEYMYRSCTSYYSRLKIESNGIVGNDKRITKEYVKPLFENAVRKSLKRNRNRRLQTITKCQLKVYKLQLEIDKLYKIIDSNSNKFNELFSKLD